MFDDLKSYLSNMRMKLEKSNSDGAPLELFMEEIGRVAIENWVDREDNTPNLTTEQINKVIMAVLIRNYNKN